MKSLYAVMLGMMCASSAVHAEEADSVFQKKVNLDTIVVVGFKQAPSFKFPGAMAQFSQQGLDLNEVHSIKDLSGMIPSFYMPDYGTKMNTPVYIRGIGSKIHNPSVVFYVDGIPYFDGASFDFELPGVSNLQVLRGPQGTLYGRNAIAGVVNVYTLSPLMRQYNRFKLGYGKANDLVLSTANNIKLSDKVGLSLDVNYHQNDGYFKNQHNGEHTDASKDFGSRARLEWLMGERWSGALSLNYQYTHQSGYPYALYDKKTGHLGNVNYDADAFYNRDMLAAGLSFRYDGNHFSFQSQSSYQYYKDSQAIDQDFTPKKMFAVTNKAKQHLMSQEFTLKSDDRGFYRWLIGSFAFRQTIDRTLDINRFVKANVTRDKLTSLPTIGFALYHQSHFQITDALSLMLGVRYDYEGEKIDYLENEMPYEHPEKMRKVEGYSNSLHFHQITPKFSLQYAWKPNQKVYATVTRGYKAGGFNITKTKKSEEKYEPEYNWNYEVGTKIADKKGRFKGELALFYIDWKHQQVAHTYPGIGNVLDNAGHSRSKGVEVSMQYKPFSPFTLMVDYGYTDAKFITYVNNKNDYSGKYLPMVPKHTLSTQAVYEIEGSEHSWFDKLQFHLGMTANGPIYWKENNAQKQPFYALLNGKISWIKGCCTIDVWSKNITNTDYMTYFFSTNLDYAQRGKPFTIGTSLTIDL